MIPVGVATETTSQSPSIDTSVYVFEIAVLVTDLVMKGTGKSTVLSVFPLTKDDNLIDISGKFRPNLNTKCWYGVRFFTNKTSYFGFKIQ